MRNMSKEKKDRLDEMLLRKIQLASDMSPDDLKEYFPHLYAEITGDRPHLTLRSREIKQLLTESEKSEVSTEHANNQPQSAEELEQSTIPDPLQGFDPGVVDFIRRARTDEEAIEIIEYMKAKGEISENEAKDLLNQLKTRGLRSFGSYKEEGYYFHYAEEKKMEMRRQVIEKRKNSQHQQ